MIDTIVTFSDDLADGQVVGLELQSTLNSSHITIKVLKKKVPGLPSGDRPVSIPTQPDDCLGILPNTIPLLNSYLGKLTDEWLCRVLVSQLPHLLSAVLPLLDKKLVGRIRAALPEDLMQAVYELEEHASTTGARPMLLDALLCDAMGANGLNPSEEFTLLQASRAA